MICALRSVAAVSLVLAATPAGAQGLVDVHAVARLPPASAALVLRSVRAADPVAYDRFRESELARMGITPDSVRRLIERFATVYDSARAVVRGGRALLEVPALKPLLSGTPHVLLDVRQRFAMREDNPLDDVVNEVVSTTLDTATIRLLRPLSAAEVQQLAALRLERPGSIPGPLQAVVDAQAFLNDAARGAPEWQSLDMEHQRRLLRALQIRAAEAAAHGAAAVAAFQQQAGAEANAAAGRISQAIERARKIIDVSDQLRTLEVGTFERVVQERQRFEDAVGRFRQQIAGSIGNVSDVRERAELAVLVAGEVGSEQLREAARRVSGFAGGVLAVDELARSLDRSRAGMMQATHDYAVQSRAVFEGFATAFGVSPEKQQRVIRTLETVAQVASIGANVAAGNYAGAAMQAIPLIASFFGKKSSPPPDVEQLRFEALRAQLGVISQKLDSIASWQLQTMARLDSLRFTVDSLGFALAQRHVELLDRLDGLERTVFYGIGLSDDNDRQALARCSALRYVWDGDYTWPQRAQRLESGPVFSSVRRCTELLGDYLPDLNGLGSLDNLRMLYVDVASIQNMQHGQGVPGAIAAIRGYYDQWVKDPERGTAVLAQRDRLVAALAAPSLRFGELNTKYIRARSGIFPTTARLDPLTFSNPLAESVVLELVRRLLEVHALYPLQDASGSLRPLGDLGSLPLANAGSDYAEERLRSAMYILDAAIAYQTLLGGDLMLPALAEDLYQPRYPVPPGGRTVREILAGNATLASNVVRHVLYQAAANRCATPAAAACVTPDLYRAMLNSAPVPGQPSALVELTARDVAGHRMDLHDVIVHEDGRWQIALGTLRVELPDPDEFARGAYETTPGLDRLWAARDAVTDALAGYEMFRHLPDRNGYTAILLYQ